MMSGGWPPNPRDRREYARMVQEKVEAFAQAATAASRLHRRTPPRCSATSSARSTGGWWPTADDSPGPDARRADPTGDDLERARRES
jgi:hypothetical protein